MGAATETEVRQLDELLVMLSECAEPEESRAAQEHIQAARTYLLGAMNVEYGMSLELAREAVSGISDDAVRAEAEGILKSLIERN
jgi:hypothetical protein